MENPALGEDIRHFQHISYLVGGFNPSEKY